MRENRPCNDRGEEEYAVDLASRRRKSGESVSLLSHFITSCRDDTVATTPNSNSPYAEHVKISITWLVCTVACNFIKNTHTYSLLCESNRWRNGIIYGQHFFPLIESSHLFCCPAGISLSNPLSYIKSKQVPKGFHSSIRAFADHKRSLLEPV